MKYAVIEIYRSRASQVQIFCDEETAIEGFSSLVREFGVEPYEEMINEKIFESDDGDVVQIIETSRKEGGFNLT